MVPAAGIADCLGTAAVGCDQGRLCRCQRDAIRSVGKPAANVQRGGQPDGDLDRSDEIRRKLRGISEDLNLDLSVWWLKDIYQKGPIRSAYLALCRFLVTDVMRVWWASFMAIGALCASLDALRRFILWLLRIIGDLRWRHQHDSPGSTTPC